MHLRPYMEGAGTYSRFKEDVKGLIGHSRPQRLIRNIADRSAFCTRFLTEPLRQFTRRRVYLRPAEPALRP